jgi:N-hydroxyarylamine O-acetyltransferase
MPDLNAYLDRIGYTGSRAPTLETLRAIHRAHLMTIPYENLNLHIGRGLPLDQMQAFEKIVGQGRGGWCYEMNGLLAWALTEMGYDVTLLASGVMEQPQGDGSEGEHLVLMVKIDGRPWLVDVGFGNGIFEPIPMEVGSYTQQGFLNYALSRNGDVWFFKNHQYGGAGFVFTLTPREMPHFTEMCQFLQTDPTGRFVTKTLCFRFTERGYDMLIGAVLTKVREAGVSERVIESEADYEQALGETFGLRFPLETLQPLWEKVWQRHLVWAQENARSGGS